MTEHLSGLDGSWAREASALKKSNSDAYWKGVTAALTDEKNPYPSAVRITISRGIGDGPKDNRSN